MNESVIVEMGDLEQAVLDGLILVAQKALTAAEDVQYIIKDIAVLEEKDAFGAPIPHKKAKPAKAPKNLPNAQLIGKPDENEVPMLDSSRWVIDRTAPYQATVTYNPPDYFVFVIEKRPWLTYDHLNDDARHRIEMLMKAKAEGYQ